MKMVALLAEGVDRNSEVDKCSEETLESPSSRRAWIEILPDQGDRPQFPVALLAEGVDRNINFSFLCMVDIRRPPRGGRG